METPEAAVLRTEGVVLLREAFPQDALRPLRRAAESCFHAIEANPDASVPKDYGFNPFSHSVLLDALLDFGCHGVNDLTAPLSAADLRGWLSEVTGCGLSCATEKCWVRKKYPVRQFRPASETRHSWHQDGALGVQFPAERGEPIPMTRLVTCWVPLDRCGAEAPGLEFVRQRLNNLLHFSELNDAGLRQRFAPEQFWAPELEVGDGLVFLDGTLHRTYARPEMQRTRLSLEYRLFPSGSAPA